MSNKRVRGELLDARMDCGNSPPEIMYFKNCSWDQSTRTFEGTIDYSPSSMQGYPKAVFKMVFEYDYSFIKSGYRVTDKDKF